ncbi:PREDICTED: uncharacterized protein At1g43920, Chloroplastic-like [Camelina sativa]|uniref:Uncharacterized protein At1g43920, Chloroplastic-like n=1 Tax=Camelina sativa TaxID=90675 RepID=A0ABM1QHK3_CAMSA|nr:PREDICTED: uncharacterized protein At1g43920, Chloroplastic-like [Camelina sativa]
MSSSSETSVVASSNRGVPSKCICGAGGHLFKWVEEAVYEEVEDALPKVGLMANKIVKTKSQVNELTAALLELKEEAL